VVKTRGRAHKHELRLYEITKRGLVVGEVIRDYEGVITSVPRMYWWSAPPMSYD
jgi:hypothetical protein